MCTALSILAFIPLFSSPFRHHYHPHLSDALLSPIAVCPIKYHCPYGVPKLWLSKSLSWLNCRVLRKDRISKIISRGRGIHLYTKPFRHQSSSLTSHLLTYPFLYPCSFKQLRTHTFAYESPLHRRIINVYKTLSYLKTFSLLFTYPVPHIIWFHNRESFALISYV